MIRPLTKRIGRKLGWYRSQHGIMGLYKGYLFCIVDKCYSPFSKYLDFVREVRCIVPGLTENQYDEIHLNLKLKREETGYYLFYISGNDPTVTFRDRHQSVEEAGIISYMDFLTELLARHRVPTHNGCIDCGTDTGLNYYFFDPLESDAAILCSDCAQSRRERLRQYRATRPSGSYLMTLICALLGAVPGTGIWIAMSGTDYQSPVVVVFGGLLICACVPAVYFYLRRQPGPLDPWIMQIVTAVSMTISKLVSAALYLKYYKFNLPGLWQKLSSDAVTADTLFRDIIISFVIWALAWVWVYHVYDFRAGNPSVHKARKMV